MPHARIRERMRLRGILLGLDHEPSPVFVPRELVRHGYGGWLVVEAEQDPAKAHPLTYARMGHDNLARAAVAAGMEVAPC